MEDSEAPAGRKRSLPFKNDYRRSTRVQALRSYFDASALAKDYVDEPGSDRVEELVTSADAVGTCVICFAEIIATLCRCERERRITRREYQSTKVNLVMDMADMDLVQLSDAVLDRTVQLLEGIPLKASDALHIASALEWQADAFVSADKKQLEAARRAGLNCVEV